MAPIYEPILASGIDSDDGAGLRANDRGFAFVERTKVDNGAAGPCNGFKIDLFGRGNAQILKYTFG